MPSARQRRITKGSTARFFSCELPREAEISLFQIWEGSWKTLPHGRGSVAGGRVRRARRTWWAGGADVGGGRGGCGRRARRTCWGGVENGVGWPGRRLGAGKSGGAGRSSKVL